MATETRPSTALPRYMQDTAVTRQRILYLSRGVGDGHDLTPLRPLPRPVRQSEPAKIAQGHISINNRPKTSKLSVVIVDGDLSGLRSSDTPGTARNLQKVDSLVGKRSQSLQLETRHEALRENGLPFGLESGILVEEVTLPLSQSAIHRNSTSDQRSLSSKIESALGLGGGVAIGRGSPTQLFQHSESASVRLPDIYPPPISSGLRRFSSELPLINSSSLSSFLQPEREQKFDQTVEPDIRILGSTGALPVDSVAEEKPFAHSSLVMSESRGHNFSEIPPKRSIPSMATLSSAESSQDIHLHQRRPSKMKSATSTENTDGTNQDGNTSRRTDDDVFQPARRHSTRTEEKYFPHKNDTARERRQSSPFHPRNSEGTRNPPMEALPPSVGELSESTLRTADEIYLANDKIRTQKNLERFHRNHAIQRPYHQQQTKGKKSSWAEVGGRLGGPSGKQRNSTAGVGATGQNRLLRTSKSQPNLIRHQRSHSHYPHQQQQQHGHQDSPYKSLRKVQQLKNEDLADDDDDDDDDDDGDDYSDEGDAVEMMKKKRIVEWLIGMSECVEPPPCPTVIEDDRPPQTDNAIHIVYTGADDLQ